MITRNLSRKTKPKAPSNIVSSDLVLSLSSTLNRFLIHLCPLSEEAEDQSDCLEDQAADDDEEEHVCLRSRLAGLFQELEMRRFRRPSLSLPNRLQELPIQSSFPPLRTKCCMPVSNTPSSFSVRLSLSSPNRLFPLFTRSSHPRPARPRHSHQQKERDRKTYTTTPCSQATSAAAWPPASSRPGARSRSAACRAWPLRIWQRPRLRGVVGEFGPVCGKKVNIGS
jgi:hypothetical protein